VPRFAVVIVQLPMLSARNSNTVAFHSARAASFASTFALLRRRLPFLGVAAPCLRLLIVRLPILVRQAEQQKARTGSPWCRLR
jgi:hypothetical protein